MTSPTIVSIPERQITWSLTPPCGTCTGCQARTLIEWAHKEAEAQLLKLAEALSPRQMRADMYFSQLDKIAAMRLGLQEDLAKALLMCACRDLEIIAE